MQLVLARYVRFQDGWPRVFLGKHGAALPEEVPPRHWSISSKSD